MKLKIKKQDTVRVIAGKDKGKTGKVLRVYPERAAVVVEGVNLAVKHVKPRRPGDKGQKTYFPKALSTSKVMVICDKCGEATRVGFQKLGGNERQKQARVCKSCKQLLTV